MSKLNYVVPFMLCLISFSGWSQKAFLKQVNDQNRVYLYTNSSGSKAYNKPLVLILHPDHSNPQEVYGSGELWNTISPEVDIIFPGGWQDSWSCQDTLQQQTDAVFLKEIVDMAFSNFKIDRNRVYLITLPGSSCVGSFLLEKYPGVISQVVNLLANQSDAEHIIREIERLLDTGKSTEISYSLYERPVSGFQMDPMDSLKQYSWHQRWVLGIHTGGLFIVGSARTETSDKTYMDIADSHSFTGIEVTKWMSDSMAWFLDISRLKIPMKQDLGSYTVTTGGGMVMPITIGFKYQIWKHYFYKPYVMLGTGPMQVMVFGGRFSTTSSQVNLMDKIDAEMRLTFHTTIGTGVDMRFGKRIVIGGQLRYIHSARFDPAGSINAVRAFNLNISASYILNAKKERSLKPLLKD